MKKLLGLIAVAIALSQGAEANEWEACCEESCGSWTLGGDWLYWKIVQDNMDYGAAVTAGESGGIFEIKSEVLFPQFQPDHGFRLFARYDFSPGSVHVAGIFTRLISNAHNFTDVGTDNLEENFITLNSASFPVFNIVNDSNIAIATLDAAWSSSVNYFDLDWGYHFSVHRCFDIVPHMGIRGMWVREQLDLNGFGVDLDTDEPVVIFSDFSEEFDGYGVEGGLYGNLHLGCGFSLVGHIGSSLLYARIRIEESIKEFDEEGDLVAQLGVGNQIFHLSPTIDGFLGLEYESCWFGHFVNLHLGWEQHIIFNINHFTVFNFAELSLQGLTLGGSIGF